MPQARTALEPQTQPQRSDGGSRGQVVYAVIVNYHHADLTRNAVESALATRGVTVRVVVIDNETDGDWERQPIRQDPRVSTIENERNVGFGAACNQGIAHALQAGDCAGVLLLNNDATLDPNALGMLKAAAAEYGLAAPKIVLPDGRLYAAGGRVQLSRARCFNRGIYEPDDGQYDHAETLQFASGCVLYLDLAVLRAGARFHEPYFLYYEDADLCLQLARQGYEVQYVPRARATHLESASTAGPNRSIALTYYDLRNRVLFLKRNARFRTRLMGLGYLYCTAAIKWWRCRRAQPAQAAAIRQALRDATRHRYGPMI